MGTLWFLLSLFCLGWAYSTGSVKGGSRASESSQQYPSHTARVPESDSSHHYPSKTVRDREPDSYPYPQGGRGREQEYSPYTQGSGLRQGTIRQTHIIFRHGDRAPIGTYPNDPNKNYNWPFGRAQLTDVGKLQHYELGTYLRNRYNGFLTSDPREIEVRSSDKDRCIASAQTNLAAFFRPSGKWVWNRELPWQPVPIHTAPDENDWLLNEDSKCPAAAEIKRNIMRTPEGIRYGSKYRRLFDQVSEKSGKPVNDPSSVLSVYGITYINKLNNLTIPSWVNPIWDEFTEAADEAFVVGYTSKPYLRMRGGPLLNHIINHMKEYDQEDHNQIKPKAFMYSTHDAMIAAFMHAAGVFNGIQVPYAATVLVEMHEHQRPVNKYTVRMYYRNTTRAEPYPLLIPNCELDCPLADFEQLMHDMLPRDIREECYGPQQPHGARSDHSATSHHTSSHKDLHSTSSSQCCCCNQCGGGISTSPYVPLQPLDKLRQTPQGEERARMQELLQQMREVMDQHRQSVDKSIQEYLHEMDQVEQGVKRMRESYKETAQRLPSQTRTYGG